MNYFSIQFICRVLAVGDSNQIISQTDCPDGQECDEDKMIGGDTGYKFNVCRAAAKVMKHASLMEDYLSKIRQMWQMKLNISNFKWGTCILGQLSKFW